MSDPQEPWFLPINSGVEIVTIRVPSWRRSGTGLLLALELQCSSLLVTSFQSVRSADVVTESGPSFLLVRAADLGTEIKTTLSGRNVKMEGGNGGKSGQRRAIFM